MVTTVFSLKPDLVMGFAGGLQLLNKKQGSRHKKVRRARL